MVLLYAERNAWRDIHNRVYEGATLKELQWSKGKQPQKGKSSKGSSKGKDNNWPKNWATQTPKGLQFCRDFLLRNKCPGNCGRSHGCPVIKDGWTCNGTHHPDQCPNKWEGGVAQLKAGKPSFQTDPPAEVEQVTYHDPPGGQTSPQRGQKHTRGDEPQSFQHNTKQPKTGRLEEFPPTNSFDHNTISTQSPTLVNDRSGPYPIWTTKDTPNDILNRLCPWTKEIPQRLARRLLWEPSEDTPEGLNGPTALILYAGADDSYSLKSAMLSISKTWPMSILEVDNKRPHKELSDDMLLGEPYGAFCRGALKGHIRALGGGPNCRTWSILRWFPKPGAPVPVRDRSPANTWGFPELTHQDQVDTDNDSLLLLRFLVILTLAHEGAKAHGASPPASFLEHPEDPAQCSNSPSAHRCSSIWAIEWLRNLLQALGLNLIHFDQCRLGQCTPKPTTLATNLDLRHWEQLRCNHPSHTKPMGTTSSDLSRYPWNMMQGLARAILESDASQGSKPPTTPANKTDRPTTQTHSPKMTLDDNPMRVQLGFRIRPIRDGGGKPSQGRPPPPLRPQSPCGALCKELAEICEPWVEDFTSSIHSGSKTHPFSIHLLRQLREKLASYCSTTGDPHNVEPGQPFHLDLLADLALSLQDPDWEYPKILREGVPLGVTSPTLRTPDVWPTKEELRGEEDPFPEYPPLQGRDNYPSAKEFTKEIEATFEEEKTMGMVLGPMTQQEAAEICGCQPDQLCPGPAGIQESDKVRTIFDGSWGGANTHIQSNTIERTTAPTVMDCVQALHWLHASKTTPLAPAQGGEMGRSTTWSPPGPHQAWTLLKADITKAHRRIKVLPTDWRFQIAQLGERSWWINKVGTYGMASAQLYWGRMAALLLRITYLIFYEVDWGFVFVDDFCWILRTESANLWATTILATYLALGVPLSWKKTVLSDGPRQTWHHHGNPPEAFSRRYLYIKGYWESPWTYQLGNQCLPPLQTFSSTLLGLEDSMQIFRQTSQAGLLVCQDVITHLLCAISPTFPLLGDLTMVGSKRCKCHQRHGYRLPNDWWLDLRPWIPRQESSVVVPNHHHSWGLPLGICRKGFISSDCCPWDVGHPPVGDLSHPTGTFFTPSATTCPHVRQPGQCLCASESTDPEDAYGSLSDAVGKPPIWSRSSTGTTSLQTGSQPMGWRLNPSWSCRFHPWETTFSHSSVWSIHSFAADFTRLEDPQSPHQPKAVKELGRPYHSTHPWSPGESGGCGWTFLCGVDEIWWHHLTSLILI